MSANDHELRFDGHPIRHKWLTAIICEVVETVLIFLLCRSDRRSTYCLRPV